jgi:hypothetical protein
MHSSPGDGHNPMGRGKGNNSDNGNASNALRRNEERGCCYILCCLHKAHRNNEMIYLIASYFFRFLHELTVISELQSNVLVC